MSGHVLDHTGLSALNFGDRVVVFCCTRIDVGSLYYGGFEIRMCRLLSQIGAGDPDLQRRIIRGGGDDIKIFCIHD